MAGSSLKERLESVNRRIEAAIKKRKDCRDGKKTSVSLLAASKYQDIEKIRALHALGVRSFGENYVQEFQTKLNGFNDCNWHFIGALQKNKAKILVGRVDTIQSVDRVSLLDTLDRLSESLGCRQKILLQVNIGGEASKGGVDEDQLEQLALAAVQKKHLQLQGIMSLPPLRSEEAEIRDGFRRCKEHFEQLKRRLSLPLEILSIGTSSDFELAIEEGATMVRIGSELFGPRPVRR